jgi:hypothetical protein
MDAKPPPPPIPARPDIELPPPPNLTMALTAGLAAAVIGAIVYPIGTLFLLTQFGLRASIISVAVGWFVGRGVRDFGRGADNRFTAAAAVLTVQACVVGHLLYAVAAHSDGMTGPEFWGNLARLDAGIIAERMRMYTQPFDVLLWGLGAWQAWSTAWHRQ